MGLTQTKLKWQVTGFQSTFISFKVSLRRNCQPPRKVWGTSEMMTSFILLLFCPSFLGVLSVIGVTFWRYGTSLAFRLPHYAVWPDTRQRSLHFSITEVILIAGGRFQVFMRCSVFWKQGLLHELVRMGVLLWSQEGGQHGYTFLLTIVSSKILIFSETGDYTWNQMGWKLWELSFPDGKWEFQTVEWFSFKALSHFSLPENVNSCNGLPYFTTFCCYWRSAVTHVPEGKVKWRFLVLKC